MFKNVLIIHEENTKKNYKHVVTLYVVDISLALHYFLWFSRLTQRIFWTINYFSSKVTRLVVFEAI
jgi:hypothetical protein